MPPPPESAVVKDTIANIMADKVVEDAIQEASKTPSTYRELIPEKKLPSLPIQTSITTHIEPSQIVSSNQIQFDKPTLENVKRIITSNYAYGGQLNKQTDKQLNLESNKENRQETQPLLGFETYLKSNINESIDKIIGCVSPEEIFAAYELRRHPSAKSKDFSRSRLSNFKFFKVFTYFESYIKENFLS